MEAKLRKIKVLNILHNKWEGAQNNSPLSHFSFPTTLKLFTRTVCISITLLLFSCWVMSSSLWPHGLQHASLLHPSLSLRDCSNSCPLSQWCCLTILFSDALIFLSIRVFSNDLVLCIRCQSIGTLASALIFPSIQGLFPSGLTGLISWSPRDSQESFPAPQVKKQQFFSAQCSLWSNSHTHTWLLEKP